MTFKSTKKVLLATAVSSAMVASANLASAADLDTLSDDELLQRIEKLEKALKGKGNIVRNSKKAIKVTLNGQINQAVRYVNDGEDQGVQIVDNDASSTRFRILGAGKLNDRFSVKTNIEIDLESNVSSQIDLLDEDAGEDANEDDAVNVDLRKLEFVFVDKVLGSLSIGAGDTSSNGVIERDLSGTAVVRDASNDDGALDFRLDSTGAFAGFDVGDIFPSFDGNSRDNRVRYDTPRYAGFSLGASAETRGRYDVTLDYKNKDLAGFSVAGRTALFVQNSGDNTIGDGVLSIDTDDDGVFDASASPGNGPDKETNWAGSLSVLHKDTGLNLTAAGGVLIDPEEDGVAPTIEEESRFFFIRAGWTTKFTDLGKTHFAASYYNADNSTSGEVAADIDDLDGEWFDINIVQKIDKLSAEVYASYIRYDADIEQGGVSVDTEAINVILAGSRIKF